MTIPTLESILTQHRAAAESPLQKAGIVIDHLVDALAGDPSSTLRRALVLLDIAQNPGTSQSAILERLQIDKSSVIRDLDWLSDRRCIGKSANPLDARECALSASNFVQIRLGFAARLLGGSFERLQNFLEATMAFFDEEHGRATLRDAKIVATLGSYPGLSRQELSARLYNGPNTTDTRAINALRKQGIIEENGETRR